MSETVQIPKGWKLLDFPDIVFFQEGPGLRTWQFRKSGMKVINIKNMVNGKLDTSNTDKHIDLDEFNQKYSHFAINQGDFLIASSASIGKHSIVQKKDLPLMLNTSVIRMRTLDNEILDQNFLQYFIKSDIYLNQVKTFAVGSAQLNYGPTHLKKIKIILPSLPTQKKIVQKLDDILGQLEEKKKEIFPIIEQNKQRIDFFEKHWRSYLITSEIENHPKRQEWKMVTLSDIVSPEKNAIKSGPFGSSLKKQFYVKSGYKIYGQEQVIRGDHEYGDYFIDENRFQMLKSCEAKPFDLLISLVGTIGKTLILPPNAKKGIINPRLIKITFNKQLADVEFFQLYLDSSNAKSHFKSESHGGTMNILNIGILKKLLFPLPPLQIQKQIVQNIKSAEEKFQSQKVQFEYIKQNYEKTINYINHIQSSILDAAFSGKLVQ